MRSALPSSIALVSIVAVVAGCEPRVRPTSEVFATCNNGADDDVDGLSDCADPDCRAFAICSDTDGGSVDAGPVDAPPRDTPPRDAPPESCTAPIDITFVLDVSTSMTEEASSLRDGIDAIWAAAQELTTDTRFSLVVFVDDALVVGGCGAFASVDLLTAEFDRWRDFCSSNLNPVNEEPNSDCAENSLDAMYAAATECTWREDATHILIHVTDDTFEEPPYVYSGGPFGGGVAAEHSYADLTTALVTREIRVGAFAMEVPEDCGAGTSGNTGRGFFTPYEGMTSLPMATGGRVWDTADVRARTLSMATAITEMVEEEHCTEFLE